METTLALTQLVSKQKVQHIDVFGPNQNPKLKVNQLYEAILAGKVKTQKDIETRFFSKSKQPYKQAHALKRKLDSKLINTLFFIDVQEFSRNDFEKFQVKSYFFLSAVQILLFKGRRSASILIAERIIGNAIKYDLTEVVCSLSSFLLTHFSIFSYSKEKSKKYEAINIKFAKYFYAENQAIRLFVYFGYFINQNAEYKSDKIPEDILLILKQIKTQLQIIPTYYFNINSRNALYFKAYLESDTDEMEKIASDAIAFFNSKKGFSKLGKFSFLQKAGIANQALKNYKDAIRMYEEAFNMLPKEGSPAWYNIRNHLFNSHLHLKQYQQSYQYLLEATTHKSFKELYELYREPWIIKEAYMHLLIKIGKVQQEKDAEKKLRPFRISRFLNEVEHFSKDKRGLNIAVHIVHVLHLFLKRQEDQLERKLDSLGQYSFRYLRNDDTLRSNAFIKMLQKMPDSAYHPIKLQRDADKYYQRLIAAPMIIAENSKEVEVIPYEHLWEIVIELLTMRHNGDI